MNAETKRHIDAARQVLVGVVPNPTSQIDQITNALIYKFMDDMDQAAIKSGGDASFFTGELERYAWTRLMDTRIGNQERMNLYGEALVKFSESKQLPELFRNIFKSAYLPYRSPDVLGLFLKEIDYFDYSHPEELGNAYEYLLSIMSSQGDAGQFRTPRHIIDFIVEAVNPTKDDKVLDPACGTGGFLISAYKNILKQHDGKDDPKKKEKPLTPDQRRTLMQNFEGYDIDPGMVRIAQVNMYLHQFKNPKIVQYDSLSMDERWNDKFDVILANPPFMSPKGGIKPHSKFGIQSTRSEVLFVDYIMNHLRPNGRAGIIVPEGIIFQSGTAYKQLRKNLVNDGLYAVVSLPSGVFQPYSGVKTSILFFDNEIAKKTKDLLFIKINNDGFDLGAQRRPLKTSHLPAALEILRLYKDHVLGGKKITFQSDDEFALLVPKEKVAESGDYNLSGDRYRTNTDYENLKYPLVEIGDLCDLGRGRVISKRDIENDPGPLSLYPVYSSQTTDDGIFGYINTFDFEGEYVTWTTDGANAGTVFYRSGKFNCTNVCGTLKAKVDTIDMKYLARVLNNVAYKYVIQVGNPKLMNNVMSKIKIPIPPLKIQKEIVEQIEVKQKAIEGAKQVIENLERERRYFGQSLRKLENIKMIELGNKEIFSIESGGTPDTKNESYWGGQINWATLVDLPQGNLITFIESTERKITDKGLVNSSAKILPKETVIVSTRATIGRVGIARNEIATNQGFKNIIIKDKKIILPYYLAFCMTTKKEDMESMASGGTFKEISKSSFEKLTIPIPPIEEQERVISELTEQDTIIESNLNLIKIMKNKISENLNKI